MPTDQLTQAETEQNNEPEQVHKNIKNLNFIGIQRQGESVQEALNAYRQNVEGMISETQLGIMNKKAEEAYEIILKTGQFTSFDCAKLGILDTTHKNRLFSILVLRHDDVAVKISSKPGDKRKIKIAYLEGHERQFAGTANEKVLQFVYENKPTREQLVKAFGWTPEQANQEIARLVSDETLGYDSDTDRYYIKR